LSGWNVVQRRDFDVSRGGGKCFWCRLRRRYTSVLCDNRLKSTKLHECRQNK
jgi:hypothetical protein